MWGRLKPFQMTCLTMGAVLTACADGVNFTNAAGVLQDSGDSGGKSVSAHVVFRDAVGVVGQDVAAVFAVVQAAGAEDGPVQAALFEVDFGFGFCADGFAEGLFEGFAHHVPLFAAAHAGNQYKAGLLIGGFRSGNNVDIAQSIAADALFVFAADKTDHGIGTVLCQRFIERIGIKRIGDDCLNIVFGKKAVFRRLS